MGRTLSFTEVSTALTCMARWDFSYGGRLAGDTLRSRMVAPALREGRAWGAAVAAWHAEAGRITAPWAAHLALRTSLAEDAAEAARLGFPFTPDQTVETENRLLAMLDHYIATADPLPNLTLLEGRVAVSIPSRWSAGHSDSATYGRASSRYRFECYLDGYTEYGDHQILVEFKLRSALTPVRVIEKQRQTRWGTWALARERGLHPTGFIVDERLNQVPLPARTKQAHARAKPGDRVPSHAKDQLTTAASYEALCREHDEEPHADVVAHLRQRQWQQRVLIPLRPDELDQAGRELVGMARLIRDLDSGAIDPVRNAHRGNCGRCRFEPICGEPEDRLYVDSLFERTTPKRLRTQEGRPGAQEAPLTASDGHGRPPTPNELSGA